MVLLINNKGFRFLTCSERVRRILKQIIAVHPSRRLYMIEKLLGTLFRCSEVFPLCDLLPCYNI